MQNHLWEAIHNLCDKCHRPVPRANDMVWLMAQIPGYELTPSIWYSRHLLAITGECGEVICEGSPSRAQYLEDQPRDSRGYPYDHQVEPIIREAWASLQRKYGQG